MSSCFWHVLAKNVAFELFDYNYIFQNRIYGTPFVGDRFFWDKQYCDKAATMWCLYLIFLR